jgi:WD40 repeat protein
VVSFVPNTTSAISAGPVNIVVWDSDTFTASETFGGASRSVHLCTVVSPDGSVLARCSDTIELCLWDLASRRCVAKLHNLSGFVCVAFRPLQITWSRENHHSWPKTFRMAVRQLVRGQSSASSVLSTLPMDVLELVIRRLAHKAVQYGPDLE